MYITLNMFKQFNISYNINTIYVAIKLNFMLIEEIVDYVIDLMGKDEYKDNTFINDLIFDIDKMTKFNVISGLEDTFNLYETLNQEILIKELEKIKDVLFLYTKGTIKEENYKWVMSREGEYFNKIEELLAYIYEDFITIYSQLDIYFCIKNFSYRGIPKIVAKDLEEIEKFVYYMPKKDNNKSILENFYDYIEKIELKYN